MITALKTNNAEIVSRHVLLVSIMIMHETAHWAFFKTYGDNDIYHKDVDRGGDDQGFVWMNRAFSSRLSKYNGVGVESYDEEKVSALYGKSYGSSLLIGLTLSPNLGGFYNRMIFKNHAPIKEMKGDPSVSNVDRKTIPTRDKDGRPTFSYDY